MAFTTTKVIGKAIKFHRLLGLLIILTTKAIELDMPPSNFNFNSAVFRLSFHTSCAFTIISILLTVIVTLISIGLKLETFYRDFFILIGLILSVHLAITYSLKKRLVNEFLAIVDTSKDMLEQSRFRLGLSFGFIWRWMVLSIVTNFIFLISDISTYMSSSASFIEPIYLIIFFAVTFLSFVWLFRQPYGSLKLVPFDEHGLQARHDSGTDRRFSMFDKFGTLIGGAFGIVAIGFYILFSIGGLYWLWMAIQIGSFAMFALGVIPPFLLFTALIGGYGFIFGMPDWVYQWFS